MTPVFMFPGQSSRKPGMLAELLQQDRENASLLRRASEVLQSDLSAEPGIMSSEPYPSNRHVQLAVFLTNHVYMEMLGRRGVRARYSLGLSLGEYNHLVHIGALGFEEAVRLVSVRGALYDRGPAGCMAAIIGAELGAVEEAVGRVNGTGTVEVANDNAPRQQVIAGERAAVEAAATLLEDEQDARVVDLEGEIPMHCSYFRPVADWFYPTLESMPWKEPELPYLSNTTGRAISRASAARIVESLYRHVYSRVCLRASLQWLFDEVPAPLFIEVGYGSTMYNLISPRWLPAARARVDLIEDEKRPVLAGIEAIAKHLGVG